MDKDTDPGEELANMILTMIGAGTVLYWIASGIQYLYNHLEWKP